MTTDTFTLPAGGTSMPLCSMYEDVPKEWHDYFWSIGICFEDYDFIILAPPETILEAEVDDWRGPHKEWQQQNWHLDRMLSGSSHNEWHMIELDGQKYALGLAFHG